MAGLNYIERATSFACEGECLVGVVAEPAARSQLGVVMIVGGPQYRVGSHRQFVLLARSLAAAGVPVLRFDCRGMGDSTGPMHRFDETAPDIAAAIDALLAACPSVTKVVLWGLCDAASGALMYRERTQDARVCGIVMLNPWVRSEATLATTYLKHYYGRRLFQKAFWTKLASGGVNLRETMVALAGNIRSSSSRPKASRFQAETTFQDRMATGLRAFAGPVLLLLSDRDLTAKEFVEYADSNAAWNGLLASGNVERQAVADADHTFSSARARDEVEKRTLDSVRRKFAV